MNGFHACQFVECHAISNLLFQVLLELSTAHVVIKLTPESGVAYLLSPLYPPVSLG